MYDKLIQRYIYAKKNAILINIIVSLMTNLPNKSAIRDLVEEYV